LARDPMQDRMVPASLKTMHPDLEIVRLFHFDFSRHAGTIYAFLRAPPEGPLSTHCGH
jgi:hypothetical protein